jgi:DNA-directed RNA polymerase I subunit RPA12
MQWKRVSVAAGDAVRPHNSGASDRLPLASSAAAAGVLLLPANLAIPGHFFFFAKRPHDEPTKQPNTTMSAIGSLIFCSDCGNLLDGSAGKKNVTLTCAICGASCKDTSSKTVVTHSKPTAFPSALRAKRSEVQTINDDDVQTSVVIQHPCEKCGREEVRYYTQQLRSADEGTTVFYECDCGHKYVSIGSYIIALLLTLL